MGTVVPTSDSVTSSIALTPFALFDHSTGPTVTILYVAGFPIDDVEISAVYRESESSGRYPTYDTKARVHFE